MECARQSFRKVDAILGTNHDPSSTTASSIKSWLETQKAEAAAAEAAAAAAAAQPPPKENLKEYPELGLTKEESVKRAAKAKAERQAKAKAERQAKAEAERRRKEEAERRRKEEEERERKEAAAAAPTPEPVAPPGAPPGAQPAPVAAASTLNASAPLFVMPEDVEEVKCPQKPQELQNLPERQCYRLPPHPQQPLIEDFITFDRRYKDRFINKKFIQRFVWTGQGWQPYNPQYHLYNPQYQGGKRTRKGKSMRKNSKRGSKRRPIRTRKSRQSKRRTKKN